MTTPGSEPQYDFRLEYDAWGQLVLIQGDGRRLVGVLPVRAFPVSDPDHWVSVLDSEGKEALFLEDLGRLDSGIRQILEEELSRREFIPVILEILSATPEEPSQWQVVTDRGPTTFQVGSEDDVRRIEPWAASVLDSHGTRFLIPDIRVLSATSRRLLDHFL